MLGGKLLDYGDWGDSGSYFMGIKKIIIVVSGKGGVGKSTVSSNIAFSLSTMGLNVGLLDADVYGPSIPIMFDAWDENAISFVKKENREIMLPLIRRGIKLISVGFLVKKSAAIIWRGPMVSSAIFQLYNDVDWGDLDYLIVDMPPGTGDVQLTIANIMPVTGGIIVSTPQKVAIADAVKAKDMLDKLNIPILGVIENMSYFVCDNCSAVHSIFDKNGAKELAENANLPFLGSIPIEKNIRKLSDAGDFAYDHFSDIARSLIKASDAASELQIVC